MPIQYQDPAASDDQALAMNNTELDSLSGLIDPALWLHHPDAEIDPSPADIPAPVDSTFTQSLPQQSTTSDNPPPECYPFGEHWQWREDQPARQTGERSMRTIGSTDYTPLFASSNNPESSVRLSTDDTASHIPEINFVRQHHELSPAPTAKSTPPEQTIAKGHQEASVATSTLTEIKSLIMLRDDHFEHRLAALTVCAQKDSKSHFLFPSLQELHGPETSDQEKMSEEGHKRLVRKIRRRLYHSLGSRTHTSEIKTPDGIADTPAVKSRRPTSTGWRLDRVETPDVRYPRENVIPLPDGRQPFDLTSAIEDDIARAPQNGRLGTRNRLQFEQLHGVSIPPDVYAFARSRLVNARRNRERRQDSRGLKGELGSPSTQENMPGTGSGG